MAVEKCLMCKRISSSIEKRRMCTQYIDKDRNFVTVCLDCFLEIEEYNKERWNDYWGSVM